MITRGYGNSIIIRGMGDVSQEFTAYIGEVDGVVYSGDLEHGDITGRGAVILYNGKSSAAVITGKNSVVFLGENNTAKISGYIYPIMFSGVSNDTSINGVPARTYRGANKSGIKTGNVA